MGALAEEGAYFFVVEESDELDLGGGGRGCVEERLDRGPRAELVVDAAGEDEFFGEAAELRGLDVEELELPVYDGGVWEVSVEIYRREIHATYSLGCPAPR